MAPPIEWWRNTLFPATVVSDWTTVVRSTRCKQNVSPSSNKQSCSLCLQRKQRSRWFTNRDSNTTRSGATKLLIRKSLRLRSSQFCAHDNKQCPDLFVDWLNFPGKRKLIGSTRERDCGYDRSKQLLMNGSSNEYAWLAYDWMKRMSCFAVRVVGLALIRLEFAIDVAWRINCVELTCNAVSDFLWDRIKQKKQD